MRVSGFGNDGAVSSPVEDPRPADAAAAPGWEPPEGRSESAFAAVSLLDVPTGAAGGVPGLVLQLDLGEAVAVMGPVAGVAVAPGDARWEADAGTVDPGDRNPLRDVEPAGVGGVLDGGFDLLRIGFGRLVGLAAALLLPLQLIELIIFTRVGRVDQVDIDQSPFAGFMAMGSSPSSVSWVFVALRLMILSFLGMTVGLMVRELLGGRLPSGRSLAAAAGRRWWVAAVIPLLTAPVKSVGFCLVYLGWFLIDCLLMCPSVIAGAEGAGPLRSFGRSWKLARASYGTALGVSVGGFVIATILQFALLLGPAALVSAFAVSEGVLLLVQQITSLVLLVTQPLTACIAGRAYVEFRCRSEGLDLHRRRASLGLVALGEQAVGSTVAEPA